MDGREREPGHALRPHLRPGGRPLLCQGAATVLPSSQYPQAGTRGWKGEPCTALLHGVCEYSLAPGPPLLGPPQSLAVVPGPQPSSLALSWAPGPGWGPTHWELAVCPVRSLAGGEEEALGPCTEEKVPGARTRAVVGGLRPYTEYRVTVTAGLGSLDLSSQGEVVARTGEGEMEGGTGAVFLCRDVTASQLGGQPGRPPHRGMEGQGGRLHGGAGGLSGLDIFYSSVARLGCLWEP